MLKRCSYIFILSFICSIQLHAQLPDTTRNGPDTSLNSSEDVLIDIIEGTQEEKEAGFDTVSLSDKQPVLERKIKDTTVAELRRDKAFWYVNEKPERAEPKEQKIDSSKSVINKNWFRNLMWLLIVGGFLAVLIWFIISSDIKLFKRQVASVSENEDDLDNQSIFDIAFESELQKALTANDYRLGIRLLYLQMLRNLSEREIIQYKVDRTNNDYLMQLYGSPYYKSFLQLTRHFEYSWYGQFPVDSAAFDRIQSDFFTFKQRYFH
ncbi:MAG TPA: DUF4129 domain-containing protein [Flavisolibacter sp.]|nr:DUF4129 domain-containing protein [Flavisolibacter sp.]